MNCPKCRTENPEGVKFCGECGVRLEKICPRCRAANPPQFKFCGECGQALTATPESPSQKSHPEKRPTPSLLPKELTERILAQKGRIEGERRQVTIMFCDLEGSTTLTEKLGDEKAFALIDEIFGILTQQVHKYEGTVQEFRGDGIMALFGAPIALENAAQRAVNAAIAIHQEVTKFSRRIQEEARGPAIRMRIGIHTGPVVLGTIGSDLRLEFQVIGDTVNLAARMESLAEPGTSYVTEETFKLTEGFFRFEGLGQKQVKGKETAVTVYQVIAPSSRRTRFDVSAEQGLTPLVGRQRDLEFLINTFRRAQRGSGQAVIISSEAGMGKSRLLYEFRKVIANEPVFFFEGKCLSYSRSVAYHPLIDILKSFFQVNDGEADGAIRDKVVNVLNRLKISTNESLPYLLELLSVKESGIDLLTTSPEAMRERIKGALKSLVIKGAQARPLILAIEDLHWIDASSREAIGDLLESIPAEPVFLVFTSRPQFTSDWGIKSYLHQVVLQSLSDGESVSMASYLIADRIDNELARLVLEKTDGVPFFIEEFVRSLKDLNLIAGPGGGLRRDKRGTLRIPATIQDIIMARVDALPETARYLLKTGSVIEREFSHELIRRATGYENGELATGLAALKEAELIYQRGIGSDISYIFKHALTMEVVHESILTSQKQQLHCQVGRAIESLYPDALEEHSATLARHFFEGGLYTEAAQYAKAAAKRAMRTGSYLDAIAHAQNRINALEQLPVTPDNQKQIIDARTVLASYFLGLGRPLEAKEAVDPIVDLTVELGYQKRLPGIYVALGSYYTAVGKYDKAYQYLHQAIDMAKKAGDWLNFWYGNFYLGGTFCSECRYKEAIDCYNISLQLSETGNHLSGISAVKATMSALGLSFIGRIDTAYAMSEESVQAAEKCGDSHTRGMAYASHGSACFFKGDFERSRRFLTNAIYFCRRTGHLWWNPWAEFWLAHTYFFTQRYKEAIEFYTRTISTMNEMGRYHYWTPYHKLSLERAIQANCGTISPGFDPATCHRENKFKPNEGIIESTIADILIKIDPKFIPEAEASVRAAIAADERNQTKWYLGQDYAVYSAVCRIKGDVPMARAHLMRAIEIFRECGADGWVSKYDKQLEAIE